MINKFIENKLNIKEYKIKLHNSGKDNITYEILLNSGESIIIQEVLSEKNNKNIEFIEKIIKYIENVDTINFANNYLKDRFIHYKGNLFQIMEKINGETIQEKDISISIIKNTAKYIALFHNNMNNFDYKNYEEINYYKKMHSYRIQVQELLNNNIDKEINKIYYKMNEIAINLKENTDLKKGVIHGDPSFKNFLINPDKEIVGLIDYDMLSVNTILWDLVDLIRSYMKIELFNKKEFEILINSYNEIRELSVLEKKEIKNYCTMMILDTGFRYLLSCFDSNEYKNLIGDRNDSLRKAERCLLEIEKLEGFYG